MAYLKLQKIHILFFETRSSLSRMHASAKALDAHRAQFRPVAKGGEGVPKPHILPPP